MKKVLSAFAVALALVGCAKQYDDSDLKNRVTTLETKVGNLEAQMKAANAVALGQYVQKVEKTDEGVTVTYGDGTVVTLKISAGGAGSLTVVKNAKQELCWAIDGEILQFEGKDLLVSQVTNIYVENGKLYAVIAGEKKELGGFESGTALKDGIFKNIEVTATHVVLTLSDNSTVNIPIGSAFKLVIPKTTYKVTTTDAFDVPYTVNAKIDGTEVDIFTDANFKATVEADKFVITPKAVAEGTALAYADSKVGLTSIVKLTFGAEEEQAYATPSDPKADEQNNIDYIGESANGSVDAHIVSNVSLDKNSIKPQVSWISVVDVKANNYTITLALEDNPTEEIRTGEVYIYEAGTENKLQTIVIAQKAGEPVQETDAIRNGWVLKPNGDISENFLFTKENAHNFKQGGTFQVKFFSNGWKSGNQVDRLCTFEAKGENPAFLFRFSCDDTAPGALRLNNNAWGLDLKVTKKGETDFYIVSDNTWHVLTVVVNAEGSIDIYDNKEYINSYTFDTEKAPDFFLERFELGMSWDADGGNHPFSQLFDGYFDYARVWNRPLAASEIAKSLCDVANDAEGLMVKWMFGDTENGKTVNMAGDTAYDLDWSKMSHMAGSNVLSEENHAEDVSNALVEWSENLCVGMGGGGAVNPTNPDTPAVTNREGWVLKPNGDISENFLFTKENAHNFKQGGTFQVKFFSNGWKSGNQVDRLCTFEAKGENPAFLFRFSCDDTAPGALRLNNNAWGLDLKVTKKGETDFYIVSDNTWHVLTVVVNAEGSIDIYDNKEYINSYTFDTEKAPDFFLERFELGMSWDADGGNHPFSQLFDGYFDYARVWNRPLAASEIAKSLCDVANDAEGLMVKWMFGDTENGKTVNMAGDTAYDLDWSKMSHMAGSNVLSEENHADDVNNALSEWTGNLCDFPTAD